MKNKKLTIAVIITLVVLVATYIALYIMFPIRTEMYTRYAWDVINRPLPIISVSIVFIFLFVWRIIAVSSIGKTQINEFKRRTDLIEEDYEKTKIEYDQKVVELEKMIEQCKEQEEKFEAFIKKVIEKMPNKKVKELGVEFYGKEGKEETHD